MKVNLKKKTGKIMTENKKKEKKKINRTRNNHTMYKMKD